MSFLFDPTEIIVIQLKSQTIEKCKIQELDD